MPSISRTTSWAGPSSWPAPSREPPTSLTTTLAPSDAIIRACSRPMPRPAPVTIATLPSHMFPMGAWDSRAAPDRATRAPSVTTSVGGVDLLRPARRDPRWLVRLLRVHGRPRGVHQARSHVPLRHLQQRRYRRRRVVHPGPGITLGLEPGRRVGDRPPAR